MSDTVSRPIPSWLLEAGIALLTLLEEDAFNWPAAYSLAAAVDLLSDIELEAIEAEQFTRLTGVVREFAAKISGVENAHPAVVEALKSLVDTLMISASVQDLFDDLGDGSFTRDPADEVDAKIGLHFEGIGKHVRVHQEATKVMTEHLETETLMQQAVPDEHISLTDIARLLRSHVLEVTTLIEYLAGILLVIRLRHHIGQADQADELLAQARELMEPLRATLGAAADQNFVPLLEHMINAVLEFDTTSA